MANMELGNLIWKITGDTKDFDKSIASTDKKTKGLGKTFQGLGTLAKTFITGVAVKAIVDMGKKLVALSSDAEETQNKFDVVFSSIKGDADSAARNLAENYGLSSRAAKQLLSDTGDLLTGFGFTQESALDLSEQVNTLAVDIASFTNYSGGAEGASAALTKALLGETESLKSLGIAISQADIEQLARDKGVVGEIDRQTKAMLTLELATRQSKNAIGDFARSQDSFSNQSRILAANFEDIGVAIGDAILPFATDSIQYLNGMITALNVAFDPTAALTDATDRLKKASNEYNSIVKTLNDNSIDLSDTERGMLDTRKALASIDIQKALADLSKGYEKANKTVSEYDAKAAAAEKRQQDLLKEAAILREGIIRKDLDYLAKKGIVLLSLDEAETRIASSGRLAAQFEREALGFRQKSLEITKAQRTSINEIAQGVYDGVINIENYRTQNRALYDEIIRVVGGVEEQRKADAKRAEEQKKAAADKARADAEAKKAAEELAKAEKDAASVVADALESELTERDKILKNIELLQKVKYADAQQEADRIEAIKILQKEYERLGETVGEVADEQDEAIESGTEYGHMVAALLAKARQEKEALDDEISNEDAWNKFAEYASDAIGFVSGLLGSLSSLSEATYDKQLKEIERQLQAELEANGLAEQSAVEKAQAAIAEAERAGDAEAEGKARLELRKAEIEEEYDKKRKSLQYKAELSAWQFRMLEATASGAMAVLNAISAGWKLGPVGAAAYGTAAAIAAGVQIAAVNEAKPVKAATGGVIPARPGGTNVIAAENGGNELLLNSAESGRAMMAEFSDQIASRIGGGNGTIHAIIQMPDGKILADVTAPYFRNGQVRI